MSPHTCGFPAACRLASDREMDGRSCSRNFLTAIYPWDTGRTAIGPYLHFDHLKFLGGIASHHAYIGQMYCWRPPLSVSFARKMLKSRENRVDGVSADIEQVLREKKAFTL